MSRICLLTGLIALSIAASGEAPNSPSQISAHGSVNQSLDAAALNRRIEVMVRTKFNIPQDYDITLGTHKPSAVAGYDTLPVTLSRGTSTQVVDFLISTDGTTLARMETFNLLKDDAFAINVAGRPIRGNPAAKVTVINFDDLECPVCSRVHQEFFPAVFERYKDKVRFIYKDNPLTELHPWALHASIDANCLAAQSGDAYWSYVDYIHTHGQEVSGEKRNERESVAALDRIARQEAMLAKLDQRPLEACLAKKDETQVRTSMQEAASLGLNFTPAIFVNGERISGYIPEEQVWRVIDRALHAVGEELPPVPAQTPEHLSTSK